MKKYTRVDIVVQGIWQSGVGSMLAKTNLTYQTSSDNSWRGKLFINRALSLVPRLIVGGGKRAWYLLFARHYRALSFGRPQASSKATYSFSQCPAVHYQAA